MISFSDAGWSSLAARRAHNPKVVGSNPAPATTIQAALPAKARRAVFVSGPTIGHPDIAHDPRYAARADRVKHADALNAVVRERLAESTSDERGAVLSRAGILHARVRSYGDLLGDPLSVSQGHLTWLDHPGLPGAVPLPNVPGALPAESFGALSSCPHVGQHTEEVLAAHGLSPEEIVAAVAQGVAYTARRQA
jgi:crotonobetainyl-CoA:carnitine CoA-transferase CaiB-like acyl-CoA transferase